MPRCKYCKKRSYNEYCFRHKPRKPINKESTKTKQKRIDVSKEWYDQNPPDEFGYWDCYLKISPSCYLRVNQKTINLEHVKSKVRRPDLKYDVKNLKAACSPCNKMKSSKNLEDIGVH